MKIKIGTIWSGVSYTFTLLLLHNVDEMEKKIHTKPIYFIKLTEPKQNKILIKFNNVVSVYFNIVFYVRHLPTFF